MDPIYCISEASGCIRYIGVTRLPPEQRLRGHLRQAQTSQLRSHRLNWLRSLDYAPTIEVIEWVLPGDREEREKYWISLFRDYGHNLVNGTDGGEGLQGLSAEARAKQTAAKTGIKHAPERTEKQAAKLRGRKLSSEHCAKIGAGQLGKKHTPEHTEKSAAKLRGRKMSPEQCAKLSAAKLGKKLSTNTSGFVGVSRSGPRPRWEVHISTRRIGIFQKIEDAVFARALTIVLEGK